MFKFLDQLFQKSKIAMRVAGDESESQRKYQYFKQLLGHNHKALEIINDLENLLFAQRPFTFEEVLGRCEELVGVVYELAEDLNALSQGKYPSLFTAAEKIGVQVLHGLSRQRKLERSCLVMPLAALSRENQEQVGGKAANLGEIANRAGLPTPRGFAVTAYAGHHFLRTSKLYDVIREQFKGLDIADTNQLETACRVVQERIMAAPLPEELKNRILYETCQLFRNFGSDTRLAVRSSATGEDSDSSFAGQHSTVLNVTDKNIIKAYKQVMASMYNPRAVFYRRSVGYRDQDMIMCVLCLNMVNARSSGVLYTVDPNAPRAETMIVSAAWGLGVSVVDGSMPTDCWKIGKKDLEVLESKVAAKHQQLVMSPEGGLAEVSVEASKAERSCLEQDEIRLLASHGKALEKHYKQPLDIEWAVDQSGKLFVLQARPLNLKDLDQLETEDRADAHKKDGRATAASHEILLSGGVTASAGAASGPAFVLKSDHNLSAVPEGAILVTAQTSPMYVPLMSKIRGIITDVGSVAGHMAAVAREFGLPTLVGVEKGTHILPHGEEITLDASRRVVYAGTVSALTRSKPRTNMMKGSPLFRLVKETLKKVVPLHLIDPKREDFRPEGCLTLHDVVRFVHEKAMTEMFRLGEDIREDKNRALRLQTSLPLNTYVLDLGGGFKGASEGDVVREETIVSRPFLALLRGMSHPGVHWVGPVGVHLTGFASIIAETVLNDPQREAPMGGPNYAIISKEYLNYSARLGYHFVTIDAFCGENVNDNYITFSFKGGAADVSRRTRRAQMIAAVLRRLGLRTEIKGDMVRAEIRKYDRPRMEDKLDQLGRLLGSVRLLDMVLSDEEQIPWYVEQFFKENYSFQR
ncbi:MAG TPA: pyruvate, phosphate dikinase [Desulfonatronum sp.]|nr:pyruvate, phosphate dikinase [Desulfonatronum sp.]